MASIAAASVSRMLTARPKPLPHDMGGREMRIARDTVEMLTSVATDEYAALLVIPSNCILHQLLWHSDAMTSGTMNVGVWTINRDGTLTAVDVDFFATALAVSSAVASTDILNEAGNVPIESRGAALNTLTGLTGIGDTHIAIAAQPAVVAGADGTILLEALYSM